MRVLLDECVPRKLKLRLPGHDCRTVPEAGRAGKKNGELLDLAERHNFEIFITMDKGLEFEQNMSGRRIAVLIFAARSNRLADLVPCIPACLEHLLSIHPGQLLRISS
ncbi:MAG TPA: DUF5615 family PIN-like protein [Candidatus Acidoferrales bacterium]|nr:DUF5615 family PIN-like protein [Candidatus Acidoferrales bacterium]